MQDRIKKEPNPKTFNNWAEFKRSWMAKPKAQPQRRAQDTMFPSSRHDMLFSWAFCARHL